MVEKKAVLLDYTVAYSSVVPSEFLLAERMVGLMAARWVAQMELSDAMLVDRWDWLVGLSVEMWDRWVLQSLEL